jgi:hypothetical protein
VTLHGHYDDLAPLLCSPSAVGLSLPNPRVKEEARAVSQARCVLSGNVVRRAAGAPDARRPLAREISVDCVSYKDGDAKQPHDYRDCFNHLTHSYY